MFARLTLEFGLAPDYVLDKMEFYEISALMQNSHYRHKEAWERARMLAYVMAQSRSSKRLKLTDICEFVWDKESKSEGPSREEVEKLRSMSRAVLQSGLV